MAHSGTSNLRNMTVGSPTGHIFAFALPLLAGSFLQQLYNMVDSWVVGNYVGDGALAAVGIGFPVLFLLTSLFMGFSNGATVVVAQFYGAGKLDRAKAAVDTVYTAFLTAALPITVVAVLLVQPLLSLLHVDPAARQEAQLYLTILCAGIVGSIGYNLNAGILAGFGNSRSTLLFLAVSSLLNIALDFLFVAGLAMGVFGAALATILSQLVSWLFGIFYINHHYPQLAIHPLARIYDGTLLRQIVSIGLPSGLQMSLVALGGMAVMGNVNVYGKEYTAGYNIGSRLDQMAFLPIQSLCNAVTSFVGQNIGAQKPDRVRRGIRITVLSSIGWSLLCLLLIPCAPFLIHFFSPTPQVIEAGSLYLRCVMPFYATFAVMFCLNNAMRGAGDSVFPMVDTVLSMILLRVPLVFWLSANYGVRYMFYGIGIGWIAGAALSVVYYFSGRWKRRGSLAEEKKPK